MGVLAAAGLLLGSGCASDCDVACGKLDACNLLVESDLFGCVDECESHEDLDPLEACAGCLDDTACGDIAKGACAGICEQAGVP